MQLLHFSARKIRFEIVRNRNIKWSNWICFSEPLLPLFYVSRLLTDDYTHSASIFISIAMDLPILLIHPGRIHHLHGAHTCLCEQCPNVAHTHTSIERKLCSARGKPDSLETANTEQSTLDRSALGFDSFALEPPMRCARVLTRPDDRTAVQLSLEIGRERHAYLRSHTVPHIRATHTRYCDNIHTDAHENTHTPARVYAVHTRDLPQRERARVLWTKLQTTIRQRRRNKTHQKKTILALSRACCRRGCPSPVVCVRACIWVRGEWQSVSVCVFVPF